LYVTQSSTPKKKAPRRIEALFTNCVASFLDYFPFLAAAFLSVFFIFFAIVISFSHLLLKQSWWDCGKPAIPSLALLLRMSSATVKKNPEYLAPGLVAAAIYCGTPP
jgi:hypothetical protein